jgi:hypothetical protein
LRARWATKNSNSTLRPEARLKEPPRSEQLYDFSVLDETVKR